MKEFQGVNGGITRRQFIGGAVGSVALLGFSGCRLQSSSDSGSNGGSSEDEAVKVGVILPLSGGAATAGERSRDGIRWIADRINNSGGIKSLNGAKIELLVADSTSEPASAATVAQRFISQNDVVAVLGAYASSLSVAISEVTERRRVPFLTMSFTDELTTRGFEYIFQVVPRASVIGDATFKDAIAIGEEAGGQAVEQIAILYEDTAYGTAQSEGLRKSANDAGVEIAMDEAFPIGINDVTPLINELRGTDAQVVFPMAVGDDSIKIIQGMRRQGLDTLVVGGSGGYVVPDFVEALGETANGVLSSNTSNYDLAPEITKEFQDRFGYFMVHEAIEHAATMEVLGNALETAGSKDPTEIRDAISSNEVSGSIIDAMPGRRIKFDETGLNTVAFPIMVQWQNQELVTVYPEEVATSSAIESEGS